MEARQDDTPDPPVPGSSPTKLRRRRRVGWALVAVAVVATSATAVIMVGQVRDLRDQQADRRAVAAADLAGSIRLEGELARTQNRLGDAIDTLAARTADRDTLDTRLQRAVADLDGVGAEISDAELAARFRVLDLATTKRCLAGVERALEQVAVEDIAGAVESITAVRDECDAALSDSRAAAGFAAVDADFPNASFVRTRSGLVAVAAAADGGSVEVLTGALGRMTRSTPVLTELPAWAEGPITQPALARRGDTWVLYYGVTRADVGVTCITRAVATVATGPYVDESRNPLACQVDRGGTSGPAPYLDVDGGPHLTWSTPGLGDDPARVWSAPLRDDGLALAGDPVGLITAERPWEDGRVAAPTMTVAGGATWLLYAGGDGGGATQAVGVARCDGPVGPCRKVQDGPILRSEGSLRGPGGPAFFTDAAGRRLVAYHAWVDGAVGRGHPRRVYVAELLVGDDQTVRLARRPTT